MHARYGAMRSTRLLRLELAAYIRNCVFLQRNPRIAALLRAVMHQAILANVEIARSSATAPLIGKAQRDVVLEGIYTGKAAFLQPLHFVVNALLVVVQRLHLPRAVVDDPHGRTESQFQGTLPD